MALPDVAPVIAKAFVPLMLDYDRATGAKDIERRYISTLQGLPWFVFVDGAGQAVVHSTAPTTGNIGYPYEPHEIEYFGKMLQSVKPRLTDADIAFLVKSLQDARKKAEGGGH